VPNHLSQLDLARRWAISPRTLERWRWTGEGPRYIKLLGRVVYRLADIEVFETDRLHESTKLKVSGTAAAGGATKSPINAPQHIDTSCKANRGREAS
jgi:hypothetical protein